MAAKETKIAAKITISVKGNGLSFEHKKVIMWHFGEIEFSIQER